MELHKGNDLGIDELMQESAFFIALQLECEA